MKKTIEKLLHSNLKIIDISKQTGVHRVLLSRLKNGKRSIDNIELSTATKLYNYQRQLEISENIEEVADDFFLKLTNGYSIFEYVKNKNNQLYIYQHESNKYAKIFVLKTISKKWLIFKNEVDYDFIKHSQKDI
ncbi:hypothetical protein KND94_001955 [Staphylococcus pseudintermedius]|uniref:hypothetical protein n=1 Tax=Staphylococcus pseudintermedius TaxID=283734 RepID=UPI00286E5A72|nr:hypothetical protein [Staphylococcus pseudintermedius]EHP0490865.1 hypothetical protein [Staphylococcus pseudintermedius]EIA5751629.1 hypothetical protein [Staphylococcus pseudintermedius]WMZ54930.1 hypothetical protein QS425_11750 [Staphylococcus pseudintermedius]